MSVTVIGEAFVDIIFHLESLKPGETYHRTISVRAGGAATVAIQLSKLGVEAKFIGKLGNDPFKDYFKKILKDNGVKDLTSKDDFNRTGLCISRTYKDGERAMIADRGANNNLSFEDLDSHFDEIRSSRAVYFSGYSLVTERAKKSIVQMVTRIKENNSSCEVFFNPGAPNIVDQKFKVIIERHTDVLILNMDEAKKLIGKESNEGLEQLNELVEIAVVTKGVLGCSVIANGTSYNVESIGINVKDTTGAGDAFSAGFMAGRLRGFLLIECAELGNKTAGNYLKEEQNEMD